MMETEKIYTSGEESEVEEVEMEKSGKIQFATVLYRILACQKPLSETHPGFLIGFVKHLEVQEELPAELENYLRGLKKAGKIWSNASQKRLSKGVIEYLESCPSLMGNWFETSLDSITMKSLKNFLDAYVEMNITKEDCSNYVSMETTSTSPTTAVTATGCAGATGSKKRKRSNYTLEETNVTLEETHVDLEPSPTWKTYSAITVLKDGKHYTKKLEDRWKNYQMKVTLYRKKDLMECQGPRDKWNHRFMEMEMNFDQEDVFSEMTSQMKSVLMKDLDAKNANWDIVKRYKYE